jgi:hypothetical protein
MAIQRRNSNYSQGYQPMSRQGPGRDGSQTRWRQNYDDDEEGGHEGNRSRGHASSYSGGGYDEDDHYPMSHEEAGRRGTQASWDQNYADDEEYGSGGSRRYQSSYSSRSHEEDEDDHHSMTHEEAGRRGAQASLGQRYADDEEYGSREGSRWRSYGGGNQNDDDNRHAKNAVKTRKQNSSGYSRRTGSRGERS